MITKAEKAPKSRQSKKVAEVPKKRHTALLPPASSSVPGLRVADPIPAPPPGTSEPAWAQGRQEADPPRRAPGSLWAFSSIIPTFRPCSPAWLSTLLHPLLRWGGKEQSKLRTGGKDQSQPQPTQQAQQDETDSVWSFSRTKF